MYHSGKCNLLHAGCSSSILRDLSCVCVLDSGRTLSKGMVGQYQADNFSLYKKKRLTFLDLCLQNVIPLWKELDYYKDYQKKLRDYVGSKKAKEIVSEALYLMSLGTNDFLENYYTFPGRRAQFSVKQYEDFLITIARDFITKLYNLGARKISLTGVPPMGCLPLERTTNFFGLHDCSEEYNQVALEFNGKLESLVSQLNMELSGIKMIFTRSVYDIFYDIIRRPSSYGKLSSINA